MERQVFEILLNDLYDRYNPSNKKETGNILDKYVAQEFDAVYYFLTKYNYPKHPNYDPKLSDTASIKNLIKEYMSGNRTLQQVSSKLPEHVQQIEQKIQDVDSKMKTTTDQLSYDVDKKLQDVQKYLSGSLKDEIKLVVEHLLKEQGVSKEQEHSLSNQDIKYNMLYTEEEVSLPKEVNDFNIGTRFLVNSADGKLVALEIKDVFYDFVSNPEWVIKEITIGTI